MASGFRDHQGRVHLSLHRDPATGRPSVALQKPLYEEHWLNETAAAAANTVLGTLGEQPTLERTTEAARRAMKLTSDLVAQLLTLAPDHALACKSGCDHCCHQIVGVSVPEALALFEHVCATRSPAELEQLKAHIATLYERSRDVASAERFSPEHPCVFLEAGRCTVYDVRPLACRGANSLDATDCERRLHDPETRAEFLARGHGGRCYVEPIRAFRAVSAGLQLGLSELYGLDPRGLDLTAAMHALFQASESLSDAWLAGEQPFGSALRENH